MEITPYQPVQFLGSITQHTESEVDPRPCLMATAQESFDRTLNHGGIIVVFGLCRQASNFVWARKRDYHIDIKRELDFDNWSFTSLFDKENIKISPDRGKEFIADEAQNPVSEFFRRHSAQMEYFATFHPQYPLSTHSIGDTFYSLLKTKFGAAAGGAIFNKERKGCVIVLPQCSDQHKEYIVVDLMQNVLTEIGQHLFPDLEGGRWLQAAEYEHASVLQLKARQEKIRSEAQSQIEQLDEQIRTEREQLGYLHGILTKKSSPLVMDVKTALETLGFTQVIDADEQQDEGAPKQEDLQIHDQSPTLLVEVKGLAGFPREGDTIQVVKYIPGRMTEWGRTDV